MKTKEGSLTYFSIFPDAEPKVTSKLDPKCNNSIAPSTIRNIIKSLFGQSVLPQFLEVEHRILAKNVFLIVFDGLDISRWNKNQENMPSFVEMNKNGFPIIVDANDKDGFVIPGIKSLLGNSQSNKNVSYPNVEAMLLDEPNMVNNGYPIRLPTDHKYKLESITCNKYGMKFLEESDLAGFHEMLEEKTEETKPLVCIDCEMIETSNGDEVARLSIVDDEGNLLLNEYFSPMGEVKDLRTQFSGIKSEDISNAKLTAADSYKCLQRFASKQTIIAGHSLENDLRALKVIHSRCIDTALMFNSEFISHKKPSLTHLVGKYMKTQFRSNGHDSIEDAAAVAGLIKVALRNNNINQIQSNRIPDLLFDLLRTQSSISMFARTARVPYSEFSDSIIMKLTNTDYDTHTQVMETEQFSSGFNVIHYDALSNCEIMDDIESSICRMYQNYLQELKQKLPQNSIILVYGPNGNFNRLKGPNKIPPGYDKNRVAEFMTVKTGILWIDVIGSNSKVN